MAIQIINCPSCGTFLLDDTAECHACGHILNAHRAATTKRRSLPTDRAVDDDMDVCSTCGESCRKGLVRCWNCGAFTRPDIEAAYKRRAESPQSGSDRRFDLPVLDATSVTESDSMTRRQNDEDEYVPLAREDHDDSDDFELSEDVHLSEGGDDASFDLSDEIHLRNEGEAVEEPSPVFSLRPIEASSPPVTLPPAEASTETIPLMPMIPTESAEAPAEIPSIPMSPVEPAAAATPAPAAAGKNGKAPLTPEEELLKIAADEEKEITKVRKDQRNKDTFVVFCPQGHRIRVREKFRGKTGKCPKCESVFIVPQKQTTKPKKKTDVEFSTVGGDTNTIVGRYARWLTDLHLHTVVPEKLKLKADSLLNEFQEVDVGFSANEILIVGLVAGGGLFGGAAKKKPAARTAMLQYFSNPEAAVDGLTAPSKKVLPKDAFAQLVLAQPAPQGTESMFGDIPIFGTGRIAIRLPRAADDKNTQYLSFSLSEFRVFTYAMNAICGVEGLGANADIPLTDQYDTFKCNYTEAPVLALRNLDYYLKDTVLKPEIDGWKCSTCGLIVSEEGRKKEKIGGLNGKGIAKAKCPKCKQKFGSNPFYRIPEAPAAPAAAEAPADATAVAPEAAAAVPAEAAPAQGS